MNVKELFIVALVCLVGYGVIIDVNETFALGEEPEFSITASTGFVVGARAEAYVAVSGTISFTVDFSS